jgi:hypothetical protein
LRNWLNKDVLSGAQAARMPIGIAATPASDNRHPSAAPFCGCLAVQTGLNTGHDDARDSLSRD